MKKTIVIVAIATFASSSASQGPIYVRPGGAPGATIVRSAGDMNADGFTDFLAWRGTLDSPLGSTRVYSGIDGSVLHDFIVPGTSGVVASRAGDVNGDGYDDVVFGNVFAAGGYGSVWVYSGADYSEMYRFDGPFGPGSWNAGGRVDAAGDVNGDGYDDVLAVSPVNPGTTIRSSRILVWSGADGTLLLSIESPGEGWTAGAGDLNADGFDDLVANAIRSDQVHAYSGRDGSLLYALHKSTFAPTVSGNFGSLTVDGAGDVNADGHDDFVIGMPYLDNGSGVVSVISGATGAVLYMYRGLTMPDIDPADWFGASVSGAGDVNGDGFADYAASATYESEFVTWGGSVRVFSGFDGSLIHVFHGTDIANERLGVSVDGGVGCDVNGDGYDDVLAGTVASIAFAFDLGATGAPGFLRNHGVACPGSNARLPRIEARGAARLGASFDVGLRGGLDNGTALLYVGTPAVTPLDAVGMIGCTLYLNPFMSLVAATDANGMAGFGVSVPANPASLGLSLEMQWVSWDPAFTPIGARLSDGLTVVVGG